MRRLIPGTYNTWITEEGDLTYYDGERCNFPIDDDGRIEIVLHNQKYHLTKEFLICYTWFEIPSFVDINDIQIIHLPIARKMFPWKIIFKNPYYYDKNKKLRLVPNFSTIAVSCDGECFNTKTKKFLNCYIGKTGYKYVDVYNPTIQNWRQIVVHQLVANAWINENQDSKNYVVNHIDGNRLNNNFKNLEWCTPTYNTIDGVTRTINTKDVIAKARNIQTQEIIEFKTFKELGKFLNIKACNKEHFKNSKLNKLYNNIYEIRLIDDLRPWYYAQKCINNSKTNSQYVIHVTEPGGAELTFNGLKVFKEYYGFYSGKPGIEELIRIFNKKFPTYLIEYTDFGKKEILEVMDKDGNVIEFKSRADIASHFNISWDKVNSLMVSDGKKSYNGIRIRKKSSQPWPKIENKLIPISKAIEVTNILTGVSKNYPTIRSVAYDLNMSGTSVRRHIANPLPDDLFKMVIKE